jgi:succinate-semialdehyde dehydrogenase / glutarate-semialdehyde dehydrogenase
MAKVVVGRGTMPGVTCGPLIDAASVAKVDELVRDAVGRGASVVTGGAPRAGAGFFYEPTVLDGVLSEARIAREEVFGPVAAVFPFEDQRSAIDAANDTDYGLASYVYSADLARALSVADQLETGMVGINRGLVSDPAAPFGGWKESGLGREGSHPRAAGVL